jgi:hypothetical protein
MNRRPAAFTMISVLLTTVLFSSVAFILTSEFDFNNSQDVSLAVLLFCAASLLGIAALGTWRPRPWGYLALVCAISLISALDLVAYLSTENFTIFYLPDMVLVGSGILILWDRNAREIFFDQSKRWWENAKRVALGLPSVEKDNSNIEIVNISSSGCLVKCTAEHKVGDTVELKVAPDLWLQTVLVRQTNESGFVFGARFEFRTWFERRQLKKFVEMAETVVSKEEDSETKAA